jgi:hypothetical protein
MKSQKRVWRWVGLALAIVCLGLGGIVGYAHLLSKPGRGWAVERFDSEQWKGAQRGQRYVYCKDLQERGLLMNLKRKQVIALLGPPDSDVPAGDYMTYIVRYREPGGIGLTAMYLLHVQFGEDERVRRVFLRTD